MRAARGRTHGRATTQAGWLMTAPALALVVVFLVIPILMALRVSTTGWDGTGSPFVAADAAPVGLEHYRMLLTGSGLIGADFMTAVGNTAWYVLLVVPLQTALALGLALAVHSPGLRHRAVWRTLLYLPSVTSAVAVTAVFALLFSSQGVVNALLGAAGIEGPSWLLDPRGLLHLALGAVGVGEPGWGGRELLGRPLWDWLAGPSIAMCVLVLLAVWTTSGTFMLVFLAALQDLPGEVLEAAAVDGATGWRCLLWITIPQLRGTITLVTMLGLIGTWQVFDQVYATGGGAPGKTLLTPAYLAYSLSFGQGEFGAGAAVAFLVCLLTLAFTAGHRAVVRLVAGRP